MELPLVGPPDSLLWRVHSQPQRLPSPPRDDEAPPNRFDDPHGVFVMRYTGATLRACLLECLARWRTDSETENRRGAVVGVEAEHLDDRTRAIGEWLTHQWVGRITVPPASRFVDVNDARAQHALGQHPDVRHALGRVKEVGAHVAPELDEATIRLSGPLGRAVTQAVARAIYDEHPRPDGVTYASRLDDQERLWAIYGFVDVTFDSEDPLSPHDHEHATTVAAIAGLWDLPLPAEWLPTPGVG